MTSLAGTRRRRTAVMLAINLTAIVALGGMGYAGYRALRRYEGGKNVQHPCLACPAHPGGHVRHGRRRR